MNGVLFFGATGSTACCKTPIDSISCFAGGHRKIVGADYSQERNWQGWSSLLHKTRRTARVRWRYDKWSILLKFHQPLECFVVWFANGRARPSIRVVLQFYSRRNGVIAKYPAENPPFPYSIHDFQSSCYRATIISIPFPTESLYIPLPVCFEGFCAWSHGTVPSGRR